MFRMDVGGKCSSYSTLLSAKGCKCFGLEGVQLKGTATVKIRFSVSVQHHGQNAEVAQWVSDHGGCAHLLRVQDAASVCQSPVSGI